MKKVAPILLAVALVAFTTSSAEAKHHRGGGFWNPGAFGSHGGCRRNWGNGGGGWGGFWGGNNGYWNGNRGRHLGWYGNNGWQGNRGRWW
jgi:hypothetical protein